MKKRNEIGHVGLHSLSVHQAKITIDGDPKSQFPRPRPLLSSETSQLLPVAFSQGKRVQPQGGKRES